MEYTVESKDLLKAQSHARNYTFSFVKSMSLKCAVELGIPDAVHSNGGEPISLRELADKLSIPSARVDGLRRLMRLLVHSGFFAFQESEKGDGGGDGDEFFLPTINSALLLKGNNATASPPFLIMLDRTLMLPWHSFSEWFRRPEASTAFEIEHGDCLWTFAERNAGFSNRFNEAMAYNARSTGELVVKECTDVFRGLPSVVDVGGGTGMMARAIADAFPHAHCTVFDLPQVVAGLNEEDQNGKIVFVGGDMFEYVPPADAALLKWILHDWSDQDCVKILKRCKEAVPSKEKGGKVIIIDMVMDKGNTYLECDETQLLLDLEMMVLTPGKERNEKEWSKIFTSAGYKEYKIVHVLGLNSIIEVYH